MTAPARKAHRAEASGAWSRVESTLRRYFHEPDVQAARAFYAAIAAHELSGQPVWPMLVAPPGCGKTELVKPLDGRPDVHLIDSVTPNTFISGKLPEPGKTKGKDGLLERVGSRAVLLYPDFSTLLGMQRDRRAEVLAQMRRIFDGKLRREFGAEGISREWKGRITFGVAVTPEIDRSYSIFNTLGERFVMIRWGRVGGIEAAVKAMKQNDDEKNGAMRQAVWELLDEMAGTNEQTVPPDIERAVAATAEITVRGRTAVRREPDGSLDYVPEPEGATRLAQQLCQLAKGSARLDGRRSANEDDLHLVHRVAFDCMPTMRAAVLRALASGKAERGSSIPETTRRRVERDLEDVGLSKKGSLTFEVRTLLKAACIVSK